MAVYKLPTPLLRLKSTHPKHLFPLGQIMATQGALDTVPPNFMVKCLQRHVRGDWGSLGSEDWDLNNQAIAERSRIFSAYPIPEHIKASDRNIWIITESDRSITTILLPSEY